MKGYLTRRAGAVVTAGALLAALIAAAPSPIAAGASVHTGATVQYAWPKYAHDGANTGVSADPSISTANASKLGVKWMAPDQTGAESSPVVEYDAALGRTVVYQGNEAGGFTAFDAATGAILWSRSLGSAVTSTPLVADGDVWVSRSFSPVLYKLDAATGATLCQSAPLASINYSTPTIGTPPGGHETVFIGENGIQPDGPVYGINAADCSTTWKFLDYNTGAGSWDPYSYAVDAKNKGLLLFGSDNPDATVYAVDAITGKKVWTFQTQNVAGGDVGTGASVTAPGVNGYADGALYISNNGGYTYALDLTTGKEYWGFDYQSYLGAGTGPGRGTAAVVGNHVIVPGPDGVICLDAVTGAVVWSWLNGTAAAGFVPSDSAAAVFGPSGQMVVAVTDLAGNLDVLDAATGALLYQHQTGAYAVTSVAESNGNLYVASGAGFLYDFGLGGSNSAAPTTTVTAPATGSTQANPGGALTLTGTASGSAIASVDVAIQSGGPNGPWWDAATGSWSSGFVDNTAHLATPGSASTGWSLGFPVPAGGGSYAVQASATTTDGQADLSAYASGPSRSRTSFVVSYLTSAPHLATTGSQWVAPGTSIAITGSGFAAGETVAMSLTGTPLLRVKATASGALSASVPIGATAGFGISALVATGETSGLSTSVPITVSNEWPSAGDGSLHQGYAANDLTWDLHIVGSKSQFITEAWSYPAGAAIRTSPAVVDDVAFFGDDSGTITALGVRNSQPLWTHAAGSAVDSSPAVASGLVMYGTTGGSVQALDRVTGQLVWRTTTTSAVESAPSLASRLAYVGSDDGTLYVLNQLTGAVVWTHKLAGAIKGSPTVDPATNVVVVGDASGVITALDATSGALKWTVATGRAVTATPTIYGGDVYVGSHSGEVYRLKEATGATVWTFTASGAVDGSGALWSSGGKPSYAVGDATGNVYLLTLATGAAFRTIAGTGAVTAISAANTWIAVTTTSGQAFADKFPGELTWAYQSSRPLSPITLVNGVAYVAGQDGTLRAFTVPGTQIP